MRHFGAYSFDGGGTAVRLHKWIHSRFDCREFAYPEETPRISVAARKDARQLTTAKAPDGSFIVADGDLLDSRATEEERARYALELLAQWRAERSCNVAAGQVRASLIIWDASLHQLTLLRSPVGVPPIFYHVRRGAVVWSDSLRTLLSFGLPSSLSIEGLHSFLMLGCLPGERTMLEGIKKVRPRHAMIFGPDSMEEIVYRIPGSSGPKTKTARGKHFEVAFRRSIQTLTAGEAHVGILLSGGIDSSLITAAAANWSDARVTAFTFDYGSGAGKWNEYERARILTRHLSVPHVKLHMDADWVANNMSTMVDAHEEPFSFGLHSANLKGVRDYGVDLLMTGALPGYPYSWEQKRLRQWSLALRWVPERFWNFAGGLARNRSRGGRDGGVADRLRELCRMGSMTSAEFHLGAGVSCPMGTECVDRLLLPSARNESLTHDLLDYLEDTADRSGSSSEMKRLSFLGYSIAQSENVLWWTHRWTQSHGIRGRFPFFFEPVLTSLAEVRTLDTSKKLIRRLAEHVMPSEIAYAPKLGQASPLWFWLRTSPLRELVCDTLTKRNLEELEIVDTQYVENALQAHMNSVEYNHQLLWMLTCTLVWKERFITSQVGFENEPHVPLFER